MRQLSLYMFWGALAGFSTGIAGLSVNSLIVSMLFNVSFWEPFTRFLPLMSIGNTIAGAIMGFIKGKEASDDERRRS